MLTTAGRLAPRCYFMVWAAECSPVEEDVAGQLFCNYGAKTRGTGVERAGVWFQKKRKTPSELLLGSTIQVHLFFFFLRHRLIWSGEKKSGNSESKSLL